MSSTEPLAGWPLPGSDGGVTLPWTLFAVGPGGPLDVRAHDSVIRDADGVTTLNARGESFEATVRWGRADASGGADVELLVRCVAAGPVDAAVGLSLALIATPTPWILIPGLMYGDNGPRDPGVAYPHWALPPADPAAFVSDRWAFRSDRAASPVVIASNGRWTAAMAIDEIGELGLQGLAFTADGESTGIGWFAPYHEQPVAYDGGPEPGPAESTFHRFEPGETRRLTCRAYLRPPDRYAFVPILRDLHARNVPPRRPTPALDAAATAELAAEGLVRWHRLPGRPVLLETASFERGPGPGVPGTQPGDRHAMHVAWLSGAPAASALLRYGRRTGDREAVETGAAVLDAVCTHLAPCGTFWGQWTESGGWGKGWTPGPALHARTIGEAALFVVRALASERGSGEPHDSWTRAATSTLEAALRMQGDDGAFPPAFTGSQGRPLTWNGDAGLAWVPALVEGAELLDRPDWLAAARRAGTYYARDVDAAFLHGAPEDVGLAPTSEDGYVAVMAYVALTEVEDDAAGRAEWLRLARHAADWMLTFRYTYDVSFDPDTALGRSGFRTRGLDQASVMNQHLHVYGLICVPELVRLGRQSGDPHYGVRAQEHLVAARQTLVRTDGEWNGLRGMAAERFYQTACFGPKGGYGALSHAWCLGLLLDASEAALGIPELLEVDGG